MKVKCSICGKETVGKFRDHQWFPRKHSFDNKDCAGSEIPLRVENPQELEIQVIESVDWKLSVMDIGGMKLDRSDSGFSATLTQDTNFVGIYFNALNKHIEFDFFVKGKKISKKYTLLQLFNVLRT